MNKIINIKYYESKDIMTQTSLKLSFLTLEVFQSTISFYGKKKKGFLKKKSGYQ